MKTNTTIRELHLTSHGKINQGMEHIAAGLAVNHTLKTLTLRYTDVDTTGGILLLNAVIAGKSLTSLDVEFAPLGVGVVDTLVSLLQSKDVPLETLAIQNTGLSDPECNLKIIMTLAGNDRLRAIYSLEHLCRLKTPVTDQAAKQLLEILEFKNFTIQHLSVNQYPGYEEEIDKYLQRNRQLVAAKKIEEEVPVINKPLMM